jgi:outer membrane protein assembly factor BamE (lipoprotein component of BamABCDE complex)
MALWIIFSTLPLLLACLGSQSLGSTNQNGPPTDPESIEDQGQGATHSFTQSCLGAIVPGVTTREEVIAKLGQPLIMENEGDVETFYYSSSTKAIFNFVLVENGVARYTSKLFGEEDELRLSSILEQMGEPEYLAYSHYVAGSRTYVYPQQGLLFIADPNMDFVFIQDCFEPQNLASFLASYGENIPEENPYIK